SRGGLVDDAFLVLVGVLVGILVDVVDVDVLVGDTGQARVLRFERPIRALRGLEGFGKAAGHTGWDDVRTARRRLRLAEHQPRADDLRPRRDNTPHAVRLLHTVRVEEADQSLGGPGRPAGHRPERGGT